MGDNDPDNEKTGLLETIKGILLLFGGMALLYFWSVINPFFHCGARG